MVLSGVIIKFPYWICWQLRRITGRLHGVVFYMESTHDYHVMEYILPHIQAPYAIAAKSKEVTTVLRHKGLKVITWPVFPTVVIMARHAFHRFPIKAIKRIGLMHGPYYFKNMISAKKYNAFDLYLFTSPRVLHQASQKGIRVGQVGGYARIDAFKDPAVISESTHIKSQANFMENKKTLLFSATWDGSGQSAVDRWADKLGSLDSRYNILVSLHPMMSATYVQKVKQNKDVYFLKQDQLYAGMLLADLMICDTSSVMAEFCALDKPMISFRIQEGPRLTQVIKNMISEISTQINHIEELDDRISQYMSHPDLKRTDRQRWRQQIYEDTSVSHGKKTADAINSFLNKFNK